VRPKRELVRLVIAADRVVRDERATRPGRGAYVCDAACFERARAANGLSRAFRQPVPTPDDTLESLDH
jgi:predicted RNA-binding protein YlxR (DUF448 family)